MKFTAAILFTSILLPTLSFAEDFSLSDGRELKGVEVVRVEQDGLVVEGPDGVEKIPFALLPPDAKIIHPYKPPVTEKPTPAPSPENTTKPETTPAVKATTSGTTGENDTDSQKAKKDAAMSSYCRMLIKAGAAFLFFLAALMATGFVARRILACWSLQQKQMEFDTANSQQFQTAYADFFAIWKLWSFYLDNGSHELPDHSENEIPHGSRWELLTRAYIAEGAIDSVFLKVTSARKLSSEEVETLGRFRQGFQTLGQAIKANKPLNWKDAEHPDYLVFKRLASRVALLIGSEKIGIQAADVRADAFRQVTSARWERGWSSDSTPS